MALLKYPTKFNTKIQTCSNTLTQSFIFLETVAELRMLRTCGVDAVGKLFYRLMSSVKLVKASESFPSFKYTILILTATKPPSCVRVVHKLN